MSLHPILTLDQVFDEYRTGVRTDLRAKGKALRAADAYGLMREQYAHVLSTFSHASYLKAPELCLAKFDELHAIGLDAFTKKYDPYWDIPLNENLPQPVIDIPIPAPTDRVGEQHELYLAGRTNGDATDSQAGANSPTRSRKTRRPTGRGRRHSRRSAR